MGQAFHIESGSMGVAPVKESISKPISGVAEPRPSEHIKQFCYHQQSAWAEAGTSMAKE